jgi:hypothetical protein
VEFLLRVRAGSDGTFSASCRQLAGAAHPDVRAVVGQVGHGKGANEMAAMVAAVADLRVGQVREVPRNGC